MFIYNSPQPVLEKLRLVIAIKILQYMKWEKPNPPKFSNDAQVLVGKKNTTVALLMKYSIR